MALRKRTNAYWQKRSTERVALLERQSEPYIRKVNAIYADAQRDMIQQMKAVYSGYYTSQGWDKEKLNSIAPTGDIKQFKAEMKRLGLDTKLPARYKGRLTRIELLYAQMWGNAKVAGAKELALSHANYAALYENSYNLTVYEVSKGLTRTPAFTKLPTTQIEAALRHKFMGKNYSQRIWKNTNDLALQLQKEVAKTIITGEHPDKAAKRLRERYNVAKYKAERLMRTETARFQNEGSIGAYESMGLDRWQFNATLDGRTSEICREHDHKIYLVSETEFMPPLHPGCRSATTTYIGGLEPSIRIARGKDGKNYYTANMSYEQWAEAYL